MTHQSPSQKHTITMGLAVPILIAAAFVVYAYKTDKPVSKATFEFEPLEIDTTRLTAERSKRVPTKTVPPERTKQLLNAARVANENQFRQNLSAKTLRDSNSIVQFAADDVIESGGVEAFMHTGEEMFTACAAALEKIRKNLDGKTPLKDISSRDDAESYRKNCGDLLPLLIEHRLMDPAGKWLPKDGAVLAKLLNRVRWAFTIHTHTPYYEQLTQYENEIYHRWRIETPDAFPIEKRLEFAIRAPKLLPDYPSEEAAATLLVSQDKLQIAFEALTAAPPSPTVNLKLRWLKKQLKAAAKAKSPK